MIIASPSSDRRQGFDDILILDRGEVASSTGRTDLAADPESLFSSLLRTGMEELLA